MIRRATVDDAAWIGELIDAGMRELYQRGWNATPDALAADLTAGRIALAVAERDGYIAWEPAYDIHHCMPGGQVCELYVAPPRRGRGLAPQLIAFACAEVRRGGGHYLRGSAVASAVALYSRVAWGWDAREVILGGRAFRAVADLAGAPARVLARNLPPVAWNHEA